MAKTGAIHAVEFGCEVPKRFFERCSACPQSESGCRDLALGKEILKGKKKLTYIGSGEISEAHVDASAFGCVAPLKYFERTRELCGHEGRCREEGLLIALLDGRKRMDYVHRQPVAIAERRAERKQREAAETRAKAGV